MVKCQTPNLIFRVQILADVPFVYTKKTHVVLEVRAAVNMSGKSPYVLRHLMAL